MIVFYKASFLMQCDILATDGSIGNVYDQYFDDRSWRLRYFVVDTGKWLPGRKVLIAPAAVAEIDVVNDTLRLDFSKEQVKESPEISSDLPVSRQMEEDMSRRFGWPAYWDTAAMGAGALPTVPPFAPSEADTEEPATQQVAGDPHLRSISEIEGYGLSVTDGEIGSVYDVIFEESSWSIRYLVIETGNWLSGRKVLIAPTWCESIDWSERLIRVALSRDAIESCPEYDPDTAINRQYEDAIYQHYRQDNYWSDS